MPQDVRLWHVNETGSLEEIRKSRLDSEQKLENWIETDINVLDEDLLVIGRQIETDYGHWLDFLCMNSQGDLVVVELKRDRTPRDVTAQALDYASWVENLSADRVRAIADGYLQEDGPLEAAFSRKFQTDFPDTINENHYMLIVASNIDSTTERIVQYLSSKGIGINFVTFEHFANANGNQFLSRVFMIERAEISVRANTKSTRRRKMTVPQLEENAGENGVIEQFRIFESKAVIFFERSSTTTSSRTYGFRTENGRQTVMSVLPSDSSNKDGLRYQLYTQRLADYLSLSVEVILDCFHRRPEEWSGHWASLEDYKGHTGYFLATGEIEHFFDALDGLVKS